MAKRATKKPAEKPAEQPRKSESLDPKAVHDLFGVPGPYEPPRPPIAATGYFTFWDCGISINELRRRRKNLFSSPDWLDGQAFAKQSDAWRWRQIDPTPIDLGKPFDDKATKLGNGDDLPLARELVVYLVLCFLATGERLQIPRLRCKDVLPSGRRVAVGPFRDGGLEIVNVSDRWSSPGLAFCSLFTPPAPRKK